MDSVIVHYQEIALKGRNRPWFVERLVRNLRDATSGLGVIRVRALMGRIELTMGPTVAWDEVRERVARIFGIANFARARSTGRDIEEIATAILGDLNAIHGTANGGGALAGFRAVRSFPGARKPRGQDVSPHIPRDRTRGRGPDQGSARLDRGPGTAGA